MKGKELLLIMVSAFILTVIWVASNVYHAFATSTIEPYLQIQIVPIAPSFDMQTVESLRTRAKITPSYEQGATLPTPQETPEEFIPSDTGLTPPSSQETPSPEPSPQQEVETLELTGTIAPTQVP